MFIVKIKSLKLKVVERIEEVESTVGTQFFLLRPFEETLQVSGRTSRSLLKSCPKICHCRGIKCLLLYLSTSSLRPGKRNEFLFEEEFLHRHLLEETIVQVFTVGQKGLLRLTSAGAEMHHCEGIEGPLSVDMEEPDKQKRSASGQKVEMSPIESLQVMNRATSGLHCLHCNENRH